jgi:hypothetical protein
VQSISRQSEAILRGEFHFDNEAAADPREYHLIAGFATPRYYYYYYTTTFLL